MESIGTTLGCRSFATASASRGKRSSNISFTTRPPRIVFTAKRCAPHLGLRVVAGIPRARERRHFGDQPLRDRLHSERDQRVNDCERAGVVTVPSSSGIACCASGPACRWCFVCFRRTLGMGGDLGNEWRSLVGFTLSYHGTT